MADLKDGEALASWAYRRLPTKNALAPSDASIIDAAAQRILEICRDLDQADEIAPLTSAMPQTTDAALTPAAHSVQPETISPRKVTPLTKLSRKRNKAHLIFVASQPCLICQRSPCDAHHIKFAQPKALGRKVSDEFTVPLCRTHHREVHRCANEPGWWAKYGLNALLFAEALWAQTHPVGWTETSENAKPPNHPIGVMVLSLLEDPTNLQNEPNSKADRQ
jgi:hypothetical protein